VKLHHLRASAFSVLALLATAPAALALDANDLAAKLIATYSYALPADAKITFGNGTVSGSNVSFDGISFTDKNGTQSLPVKLQFNNVQEGADGSYTADSLSLPDVDYSSEGNGLSIKNIIFKQILIPAKPEGMVGATRVYGSVSAGPIALTVDGVKVLSVDSIGVNNSFKPSQADPNLTQIDTAGSTAGLTIDLTGIKDKETLAQAKMLGLETITAKLLEQASWTFKDGHLAIAEVSADADKIGKLKFSLDVTGYTPEFLQNLSDAGKSFAASQSGGDAGASQAGIASLMAAAQNLFLNSISLRFDDASITGKLLDMMSAGAPRDAFVDALVSSIAEQSGSDNSLPPDMVKLMQAAARAYLTDPHSIEVRLAPKTPLGVLGITGAVMAPVDLANQIGLQVLVNDRQITEADAAKESGPVASSPPTDNTDTTSTDNGSDDNSTDEGSGSGSGDDADTAGGHAKNTN
jgi:hypothetical protein